MAREFEKVVIRSTELEVNRDGKMPKQEILLFFKGDEIPDKGRILLPRDRGMTPFPEGDYLPVMRPYLDSKWRELKSVITDLRPLPSAARTGTNG